MESLGDLESLLDPKEFMKCHRSYLCRIGYAYTESEKGRDDYRKAVEVQNRGDWSASSQFTVIIRGLGGTVLTFLLYSTVLGTLSMWMVLILLALAVLGYLLDMRENRFQNSLRQEEAVTQKHFFI